MSPIVVPAGTLKLSVSVLLHGAGVVCPAGQTFTLPKSAGGVRPAMPSSLTMVDGPALGVMMRPALWMPVFAGANWTISVQGCPEDRPCAPQVPPDASE